MFNDPCKQLTVKSDIIEMAHSMKAVVCRPEEYLLDSETHDSDEGEEEDQTVVKKKRKIVAAKYKDEHFEVFMQSGLK